MTKRTPHTCRPPRTTLPAEHPRWQIQITDDGSRTLIDPSADVAFHSASGALTETQCVYLRNSGVAERLAARRPTAVLEVGLGTGMGMLSTLDVAGRSNASLRYVALESEWLPAKVIRQLEPDQWLDEPRLADRYLDWRESLPASPGKGIYHWWLDERRRVEVQITPLPREFGVREFGVRESSFDAIYFDPFAPDVCGELWTTAVLDQMFASLKPSGRLTSYCVSRLVRERLTEVGFRVTVVRGPAGGKRDVLIATRMPLKDPSRTRFSM